MAAASVGWLFARDTPAQQIPSTENLFNFADFALNFAAEFFGSAAVL
jgi:hypothetical protein